MRDKTLVEKPVFTKIMMYNRKSWLNQLFKSANMKTMNALIYAWISEKYMDGCSNYNSLQVRKSCRSKAQGRAVFADNDVPHAHGDDVPVAMDCPCFC